MPERKSQPRKSDVVVDEDALKRRDRFRLAVLLVGGVAVVELMGIVAGFLSNSGVPTWLYYALGATVALGAAIYLIGRFAA
ncbi:MAG TPA: hypothetical protein VHI93_04165, partial [Candidatus Thermoplasmatota archaeon]|nr:hypothetical protein [Candidatus Thermoplasmatota archaeon]